MEKINVDILDAENKDKKIEEKAADKRTGLKQPEIKQPEIKLPEKKKMIETPVSDEKIKKILLDENLMPKRDVSEQSEKTERCRRDKKKVEVSEADGDKISILSAVEEKLEQISEWFQDRFEQLMDLMVEPTNDLERYKFHIRKEKLMRWLKIGGISAAVLLMFFGVKYVVEHHSYSSYSVISQSEKVDTGVSHFMELDGRILHYSADGASLTSAADDLIWTDSYQMSQPVVETFDSVAAIYDLKGTLIAVYDENGKLGSFQTDYPILKASVSSKGGVAVILENGETTLINYYTETGSLIASSSTNMKNPGYPVDLSVSKDGLSVVVTYFVADEDTISSYIAFYNFGDIGKNKEDNLLDGVRCAGVLVPEVQYLDNNRVIAYSEEGFKIYKVKNKAEEVKEVIFEDDIVSSFSDGKYIGFIFRNNNTEQPFLMKVFDSWGNLEVETTFDILYDDVKISDDKIILNNATQLAVYSIKGIEKYSGTIEEGSIHEIIKVGMNRYTVAYNGGVVTIKLK